MCRNTLILIMLLTLASCDHKEVCLVDDSSAGRYVTDIAITYEPAWELPYENHTDWKGQWDGLAMGFGYDALRPSLPEGIRMKAYNVNGNHIETNMPASGEDTYITPGENVLLFYNNDTEFIVFNDMDSYSDASVTTRNRYRSSYTGNPCYTPSRKNIDGGNGEMTVSAPDVLFCNYIDSYVQTDESRCRQLGITMRPLVFTYVVRYYFAEGYEHVALARGALAGMAGAVSLHDGHTSDRAVTVLYDCTLEPWGIQAVVRSFGIPDFPNPSYWPGRDDFALSLEVRLTNGKILNFYFNVTDQMSLQPRGGVITVDGIRISDVESDPGNSGFDVSVDGWGEFEDVSIAF